MPRRSKARWSKERREKFYKTISAKRAARVRRVGEGDTNSLLSTKNSRRGMKYAKKDMRIVLARKLRWHIVRHIKTSETITELELNALLLINEILKSSHG